MAIIFDSKKAHVLKKFIQDFKNNLLLYEKLEKSVIHNDINDNNIIVTYGNYFSDNNKVFLSTNSGASWQNITYNLGNMPIRTVVIDSDNNSTIYLTFFQIRLDKCVPL